jgi:hypothetical protein
VKKLEDVVRDFDQELGRELEGEDGDHLVAPRWYSLGSIALRRKANRRGTGSKPPRLKGLQRKSRQAKSKSPRPLPKRSIAVTA